jgi:hypothetical protein
MSRDIGPKPDDPTEAALWDFAFHLNALPPYHPSDVDRFYRFVVIAHQQESPWQDEDVKKRLLDFRIPIETALEFAKRYDIGQMVLLKWQRMERGDERPVR